MAASSEVSFVLSLCSSLFIIAGMQMFKTILASTKLMTIFGGYLGSLVFVTLITAISNLEMSIFGENFQAKFFEVILSLLISCFISGLIHRVSITTCFIFSILALYYLNKISVRHYQQVNAPLVTSSVTSKKKK